MKYCDNRDEMTIHEIIFLFKISEETLDTQTLTELRKEFHTFHSFCKFPPKNLLRHISKV